MSLALQLPPIPAPPHDPRSFLLAGWIGPDPRVGFRVRDLQNVESSAASGALVLGPTSDAQRRMTEPSGSFGGLRAPLNVARAPGGEIYLLDPLTGQLKRFDACQCAFVTVPCFTRVLAPVADACQAAVTAARPPVELTHLLDPHGIAICGGDLFVADSGHARVGRFALQGFIPRAAVVLPRFERQKLLLPWFPVALAFDGEHRLYVADPHNQRIDLFDFNGRWRQTLATPGPVWALAVDCQDRPYALLADAERLDIVDEGFGAEWRFISARAGDRPAHAVRFEKGRAIGVDVAVAATGVAFPPFPLAIDAHGMLHIPCGEEGSQFDARGSAVGCEARQPQERYRRRGIYASLALDSRIDGCPWHRVELRGSLPEGCTVTVRTLTAEVLLSSDELAELAEVDGAWRTNQVATDFNDGRWDCLITSPPGRYLWLCLDLSGTGLETPCLEAVVVEYPRISLRRYLPAVFGADPTGADFTDRFMAIFDTTLRSIESQLDRLPALFDPLSAPSDRRGGHVDFLTWLGTWIGITLARDWPPARRRQYLKQAGRLFRQRGTPEGLRRQLLLFLGFDDADAACLAERPRRRCVPRPLNCAVLDEATPAAPPALLLEHFRLRRWLFAGQGRLGDDSVLWGKRIINRSQLSGTDTGENRSGNARLGESQLITTPDPLHDPLLVTAHRVSVFVPASVRDSATLRRGLGQLLALETPAHVQYDVRYVEPRFRVGVQAMIGFDSVIARTPGGVRLSPSQPLGQGTVLARSPDHRCGPRLQVGDVRVGTTTVLT